MEEFSDKVRILVVDDRPDKLLALRSMLGQWEENLVCVRSGNEALREILKRDFAVILLDVNMPIMDGFETAALIRKRQRSETTPIIFISAVNDAETHVSRGYSLGAVDYILTPVVPEILRAKIAVFVDLFRKTEQVKHQAEEHAKFLQEQAARLEAEAGQERFAFLAEAGIVLAGSLDMQVTLENLARLVVPRLGHFCIVNQLDEDGELKQIAAAHRDPEKERLLLDLEYPKRGETLHAALRVIESRQLEYQNDLDEGMIDSLFAGVYRNAVKELAPRAYIALPIMARDNIIGSITMVRTGDDASYSPAEISLATVLAQRIAFALDNASLYLAAHRAKEEAEAANRAKDRFLAMLSHELRTPLTPVITSILNLEADESVQPQVRQALQVMRRNVELESRLIDDLLDLTRVGSGKIHLNIETVDAQSLLENAVEICRPDIASKSLSLTLRLQAEDSHVEGDPARMQQIFWNLIRNAMKFTHQGGISVQTHNQDGRFHIQISDTGIGMESELIERIFKPFEQGENGRYGGLGLGLTITSSLVDIHEGEISVTSGGPGTGSTFSVSFPIVAAPTEKDPASASPSQGSVTPLRVLLVEDHADTNETLTMLLKLRGYSVVSAMNVRSAVEIANEEEFDVLLSDLGLPDGEAKEVLQVVASRYGTIGIALSGFGMDHDIQASKENGFSHHLVKPVQVGRLDALLREISANLAACE
ncbi:response regulator [Luteolibacter yonseiensis]|uniref:histidine kinase n=1 Tax=Luteolibacter yonseiensis TaxID=1144680 RepID=A0A934VCC5_9BACT|nr:response regulator [Luteolibacter yonseiensis]MBK1817025.1 response regulator [Luteolibacter yonseiensis]